jgi:hypothetical protein
MSSGKIERKVERGNDQKSDLPKDTFRNYDLYKNIYMICIDEH